MPILNVTAFRPILRLKQNISRLVKKFHIFMNPSLMWGHEIDKFSRFLHTENYLIQSLSTLRPWIERNMLMIKFSKIAEPKRNTLASAIMKTIILVQFSFISFNSLPQRREIFFFGFLLNNKWARLNASPLTCTTWALYTNL